MQFRYEELRVGKIVLDYVDSVYRVTASFPGHERYTLTSQLRRAAISVYLNLAEGSARRTKAEFARFITMSLGSLVEVDAALKIALRQKYINQEQYQQTRLETEQIWISLCSLRRSQQGKN